MASFSQTSNLRESLLRDQHLSNRLKPSGVTPPQTIEPPTCTTTPPGMTSNGGITGTAKKVEVEKNLLNELSLPGAHYELSTEHLDDLLHSVAKEEDVRSFIRKRLYSKAKTRWTSIPANPRDESELYAPFTELFNKVLQHFDIYDDKERLIINSSGQNVEIWSEAIQTTITVKSAPDLRVAALGDHFRGSELQLTRADYTQVASPIEIKVNDNQQGKSKYLAQCAFYARQCLIQQKGRRWVYVPLFTEEYVQLYLFDRGGVIVGPRINYHERPEVLVRIILLVSGGGIPNAQTGEPVSWARDIVLGVNPSITWEGSTQYIRVNNIRYRVTLEVFGSKAIRGRGTCVWRVVDDKEQDRVIKYLWRAKERTPEWYLLGKVKGLPGVAQLLDHQIEPTLHTLRPAIGDAQYPCHDREASFMVLEGYGANITKFKSPIHFLEGLRDAIAGHRYMWERRILHRDISVNNILYGPDGAKEGHRGVVIDMDLSIEFDRTTSLHEADWFTGTRAFQSVIVLRSERYRKRAKFIPVHDYLDDLESFFWVFLWVTIGFEVDENKSSKPVKDFPQVLAEFETRPGDSASNDKHYLLMQPEDPIQIHQSWPEQFDTLKVELARFLDHHSFKEKTENEVIPTWDSLRIRSTHLYQRFLGYIDQTIADLKSNTIRPPGNFAADLKIDQLLISEDEMDEMGAQAIIHKTVTGIHAPPTTPPPPKATFHPTTPPRHPEKHCLPVSTPPHNPLHSRDSPLASLPGKQDIPSSQTFKLKPVSESHKIRYKTSRGSLVPHASLPRSSPPSDDLTGSDSMRGRVKRALEGTDSPSKRFKTPTGSIRTPTTSIQRTPGT